MTNVVMIGSLNLDLIVQTPRFPRGGETVHGSDLVLTPGGKSANQAVAAARLGAPTALIGCVGDDSHADIVLEAQSAAGVNVSRVRRVESASTGTAVITVDAAGENTIIVSPGANASLNSGDIDDYAELIAEGSVVCLCLESPITTVMHAAEVAHRNKARVLLNLSPYADVPRELLALVDVLLVNEHELAQMLGSASHDWTGATRALSALSVRCAVVTRGAEGAVVLDSAAPQPVSVPSPSVDPVDTTGAGDAFTGALAARLADGDTLVQAAEFAVRVGAFSTLKVGAQTGYPTTAEIENWP